MIAMALAPQNLLFSAALAVVLLLFVAELIGLLIGTQLSGTIDHLVDFDGVHLDAPATVLDKALAWLHVGRVPLLFLLIIFLLTFGVSGLILQQALSATLGLLAPGWIAAVPAAIAGVWSVRIAAPAISRVMPQDETTAVSRDTFIGRVATITNGTARSGAPTQAKLRDQHGQVHYVMVEPDLAADSFTTGDEVLVVAQDRHLFRVIRNSSTVMSGHA